MLISCTPFLPFYWPSYFILRKNWLALVSSPRVEPLTLSNKVSRMFPTLDLSTCSLWSTFTWFCLEFEFLFDFEFEFHFRLQTGAPNRTTHPSISITLYRLAANPTGWKWPAPAHFSLTAKSQIAIRIRLSPGFVSCTAVVCSQVVDCPSFVACPCSCWSLLQCGGRSLMRAYVCVLRVNPPENCTLYRRLSLSLSISLPSLLLCSFCGTQFDSSECAHPPLHCNSRHIHMLAEEHSTSISERCTRSRINSAIFVSSEGRGFDSIEFLRRHGSQSVLCRKAKSAENITDNGGRKSLRPWRTDDESCKQQHLSQDSNDIELKECGGGGGELLRLPVIHDGKQMPTAVTSLLARSAAITTANMIVGSISLEAPPPYMQDDEGDTLSTAALIHSDAAAVVHESQESAETVEELVHVPLLASATATASVSASSSPSIAIEAKPRVLVHQRSSTASSSPHSSPKNLSSLGLKIVKPKISAVPMVSVSGPSPPIEKPPLAECL
ncbi:uncharacterized protein LOC6615552 isoform X5 [Drosophila sechellia]|uniref:uncharacterized protein LOC6615552 isoform X5 n=1 Tax=Drosophila sechellia TaxID=7238 RepID=UPI0013DE2A1F|nr:uncharacterized protein LOC6615552 isoform X5 [Drosophila sechellia]